MILSNILTLIFLSNLYIIFIKKYSNGLIYTNYDHYDYNNIGSRNKLIIDMIDQSNYIINVNNYLNYNMKLANKLLKISWDLCNMSNIYVFIRFIVFDDVGILIELILCILTINIMNMIVYIHPPNNSIDSYYGSYFFDINRSYNYMIVPKVLFTLITISLPIPHTLPILFMFINLVNYIILMYQIWLTLITKQYYFFELIFTYVVYHLMTKFIY